MVLSIVLLNFNKSHLTLSCAVSLYKEHEREFGDGDFELIIVDNNSEDDSVAEIKKVSGEKKYKNIHLIENKENFGFAKGCNAGAAHAKGEYILFLNNDTVVKDKGILGMVDFMQKNVNTAIVGGQLKNIDGTAQPSVGKFYTPLNTFYLLIGLQRLGIIDKNPKNITEVDWVKGGLLMVRASVFEKLNGFDEKIFMYIEDMELCYRAKKAGYKVYFYPDIHVIHEEQGSSNRAFAIVHIYKGLLYFYKKHMNYPSYLLVKSLLFAKAWAAIGIGSITQNKYLTATYRKALQF